MRRHEPFLALCRLAPLGLRTALLGLPVTSPVRDVTYSHLDPQIGIGIVTYVFFFKGRQNQMRVIPERSTQWSLYGGCGEP